LKNTRNILIQGPPGTGKSQSLTAILVNALENHKKTIVVCEKRTALEVLHNSLNEKGLNYQCVLIKDIVKDRRSAVNSVRERIDNSSYRRYRYTHSKESLDGIIDKAKSLIDSINKKHIKLDEKLVGSKNWTRIVGELLSELKGNEEDFNLEIEKEAFKYESTELNEFLELIRKGQLLYNDFSPNKDFSFLNPLKLNGDNPFIIEEQILDDFSKYKTELTSISKEIDEFKIEYFHKRHSQLENQLKSIIDIDNEIQSFLTKNKENEDFYLETKTGGFFYKTISIFSKEKKQTIIDQQKANSLFSQLSSTSQKCNDIDFFNQANSLREKAGNLNEFKVKIESTKLEFGKVIEIEFQNLNLLQEVKEEYVTKKSQSVKAKLHSLEEKISLDSWATVPLKTKNESALIKSIQEIIQNKEEYFSNEDDLFSIEFKWFQFYNSISELDKIIIDQLLEKVNWKKVFLLHYLNSMLVNSANTDLPTNDNDHKELSNSLSNLEQEQLKYIKEYWYSKQIDATREFDNEHPNLAVENLYNKKAGTKHKRLSLRQIVEFDIDLFTTFFPIILTTPDVCSNLFKGKNKYFDIVMFDEASQLKLEDNLPALLKGNR